MATALASCRQGAPAASPIATLPADRRPTAVPTEPNGDFDAVADLPAIDIGGIPVRAWVERKGDGTVGIVRVSGHAPGEIGLRIANLLHEALGHPEEVQGFASECVAELRPAPRSKEYAALAASFVAAFSALADAYPRFVELRDVAIQEDAPSLEPAPGDEGSPILFRALDSGPAFIPMRKTSGEDVWVAVEVPRDAAVGRTVVSGASDGPAWPILLRRFASDCAAAPNAARTVFFKLREAGGGRYQASCVYLVVGPYVEIRDPEQGLVMIATPEAEGASPGFAKVNP
jgi:hypothetical protein